MSSHDISGKLTAAAERIATERGLELVHAEIATTGRGRTVRIVIDKPDGVSHQDCADVSLHLGTLLDVEDFIPGAYTLEVSSPGLERELYKPAEYERFAGEAAKIRTNLALNGQRNFRGRIVGLENDDVIFDDKTNGRVTIPFAAIGKANLEIDLDAEFKRAKEKEAAARAAQDAADNQQ